MFKICIHQNKKNPLKTLFSPLILWYTTLVG